MYFLYHNLILFSEKHAQMFYQKHSLVLHTVEIFCNLTLRNHWISDCPGLGITLYWTWTRKILELP